MSWMQAAAAAAPVILSLIGDAAARGDDAEAERLRQEAMAQYNIELPPVRELLSQAATASNPQAKASRLDALRMLQERASEGYNAEDRAGINDMLSDVNQRERGQRMAITQGMDPNSGAAVAAQLSNQQAGAQRANQQGVALAGQSRANAMRALMAQGQLAGQIEQDEFQRGQAGDAMAQFNERNKMSGFDRQLALANGKADALTGGASSRERKGDKTRRRYAGIGKAAGKGIYGVSRSADDEEEDG